MADADDPAIDDEASLWRRIPPDCVVFDENQGRKRPSSKAFQNQRDQNCFSIFLGDMITGRGDAPDVVLIGHDRFGLASISAGLARECHQGVVHEPTNEEAAHGLVVGAKTPSVKSKFAKSSVWIINPAEK